MNVICAIAKNEEFYIKDWCEYHLNLGFDHIYVYDNSVDEKHNLSQYVDNDKVTFIPRYGIHKKDFQNECYNDFYKNYKFDWCAYIDIDEYINISKWKTIGEMLSDSIFNNYNVIRLNWHMYGDDNLISRDMSIPVYKGITKRINHQYGKNGKEILRGGIPDVNICSSHYCKIRNQVPKQVMPDGKETQALVGGLRDCNEAWINHYMTKTLDEFINSKLKRGTDAQFPNTVIGMNYYWYLNQKTPEKLNYLKGKGL